MVAWNNSGTFLCFTQVGLHTWFGFSYTTLYQNIMTVCIKLQYENVHRIFGHGTYKELNPCLQMALFPKYEIFLGSTPLSYWVIFTGCAWNSAKQHNFPPPKVISHCSCFLLTAGATWQSRLPTALWLYCSCQKRNQWSHLYVDTNAAEKVKLE